MRIILIGQAPFGASTLEALLDAGEDVVATYTPAEKPGAKPDALKQAALERNIRVVQPPTYKDDGIFREFAALRPDLVVLAFVTDLIPMRFLDSAPLGSICYHPSLLPRHRGASAINWAIIMGDDRTGLSIFWPDAGIDTGPILLQKEVEIRPEDTAGSLYFDRLFPLGVNSLVESVGLIKAGKAPRIAQDDSRATYEPPCSDKAAAVDWTRSGRQIYNLIRGCDPQPGAYSQFRGEKIRFYNARFEEGGPSDAPGTVIGIGDRGIRIAVPGGELLVGKVRPQSAGKVDAASWAGDAGIRTGEAFTRA